MRMGVERTDYAGKPGVLFGWQILPGDRQEHVYACPLAKFAADHDRALVVGDYLLAHHDPEPRSDRFVGVKGFSQTDKLVFRNAASPVLDADHHCFSGKVKVMHASSYPPWATRRTI
jgi:hypothetical protein